ncbi:MAG: hypothetical protein WC880_00310 [Candidatus Paceibacterota bacterium]
MPVEKVVEKSAEGRRCSPLAGDCPAGFYCDMETKTCQLKNKNS